MATKPSVQERIARALPVSPLPGAGDRDEGPSEESLAREWVMLNGEHWRFDHTAGKWFQWTGTRWERDECRVAVHLIGQHLKAAAIRGRTPKPSLASRKVAGGVEAFAQANPSVAVTHSEWDKDLLLLGTPEGTADLRNGTLRPAAPADHITKLAAVAPKRGTPTLWLRFLEQATGGDAETIEFLRRWCGYCLTGDTREHALAFVYGPGGNGKSVFLNAVSGILGDYAVTAAMETFTVSRNDRHSTELAMLAGARLVTASETDQGRGWAEAKIKSLTGGDKISARFMRKDFFTFTPQFKLMIAGNFAPTLRNVDEAMRRRLNIIPFTRKPDAPDRQLEAKLRAEWPQILQWMIEGCTAWQRDGLKRPATVATATDAYFSDQDLFGQWLEDRCTVDPSHRLWETPDPLFRSWRDYAAEAGEQAGKRQDFKVALERRGIVATKTAGLRVYRGVQLKRLNGDGGTLGDG